MLPVPVLAAAGEELARLRALVEQRPDLITSALVGAGLLVALTVVVVILVLIARGLWRLWRANDEPGERLHRTLAAHDRVAVLMHADPDPDAMGAAIGVSHLATDAGTDAAIFYPGEIRHPENRAVRAVLDTDFQRIEHASELPDVPVVLVDHGTARGFDGAEAIDPIAVVDHHPHDSEGSEFTDVRPEYGACATIVAEYFQSLDVPTTLSAEPGKPVADGGTTPATPATECLPSSVATALLYGIQTDTANLSRGCSPADFDSCSYLHPVIDSDALDRIANPPIDADTMDVRARAIENRVVRTPVVVSDVGEVANADAVPQAAEELFRLEGANTVVVFGRKDGSYRLSARSRDDRVHVGKALERALVERDGAEAGGHARMGGGQVPVIDPPEADAVRLQDQLFAAMHGELG